MRSRRIFAVVLALIVGSFVAVQGAENATSSEGTKPSATAATKPASPYEGSWLTWPKMTGDWGGARTALADMGITFDIDVTQILQDNAHGGASTKNGIRYSGSGDLTLKLDTGKMGLWPDGMFILNAEPKWGNGINKKVGSLIPVNMDAIKPTADDAYIMTLSEFFYQHVLFDGKLILLGGKLDAARAFDTNMFANNERTQFMNVAFRNNLMLCPFAPYTTFAAGAILSPTDWLTITTAVCDNDGRATTTGFETAFHGDPDHFSVAHEWAFKVKPFGLSGNQRVGFSWSPRDFDHVDPVSPFKELTPALVKLLGWKMVNRIAPYLPYENSDDNVMVYCNFDQYLYTEANDPTQGIGLFGRFGWARQDVNAPAHFYSIGLGGKGVLPDRDKDTMGVGYYFLDLSNNLPSMMHSEQGIEAYYNIELAPWLHISPDLQVIIDPGGTSDKDVSVVAGFRVQMDL